MNVSSLTKQISVQVCNESDKPLLLTPQLVIAKLSPSNVEQNINFVTSFSSRAKHTTKQRREVNFSDWARKRFAQHANENANVQIATQKLFNDRDVAEERRKEEKKEDIEMEGKSAEQGTAKDGKDNGPDAV